MSSIASRLRLLNAFWASTKSTASDDFHNHPRLWTCDRFGFVSSTVTDNVCAVVRSSNVDGDGGRGGPRVSVRVAGVAKGHNRARTGEHLGVRGHAPRKILNFSMPEMGNLTLLQ